MLKLIFRILFTIFLTGIFTLAKTSIRAEEREPVRTEKPPGSDVVVQPLTPEQIKEHEIFRQKHNPQNWHKEFLIQQKIYKKLIPSHIKEILNLKNPKFKPIYFGEKAELTVGDFNCDGSKDYAITGLLETAIPKGLFKKSNADQAETFKSFFIDFEQNKPALIVVILSGKKTEKFDFFKGSYVRNGGQELPGCFDLQGEDLEKAESYIKKNKCDFLYSGCCEKDGSQTIYEKNSTKSKFDSGC